MEEWLEREKGTSNAPRGLRPSLAAIKLHAVPPDQLHFWGYMGLYRDNGNENGTTT